jgi:murein peptide amidase A
MGQRSYTGVSQRIEALSDSHIHVETAGSIGQHPVYHVLLRGSIDAPHKILLTAGVHGNEPSGVEAVLRFLEKDHGELLNYFEFSIIPCVNPEGYVRDIRENGEGIDINRAFEEENVAEVQIVKNLFRENQADCFIDLHEDWEGTGFYLYEGARNGQPLGPRIIRQIETIGTIDPDGDGDNDDNELISRGVYAVATSWGTVGLAPYMLEFHAFRAIISEAPSDWPMETRVAAHLSTLETVLACSRETHKSG